MNKTTAPYIPTPRKNWSYNREAAARLERAKRDTKVALGAYVFRRVLGEKPIIGAVLDSNLKQVILLHEPRQPAHSLTTADLL